MRLPSLPPSLLVQARGKEVVVLITVDREGRVSFDSVESSSGLSTNLCKLLAWGALTAAWAPARDETGRTVAGTARIVIRP